MARTLFFGENSRQTTFGRSKECSNSALVTLKIFTLEPKNGIINKTCLKQLINCQGNFSYIWLSQICSRFGWCWRADFSSRFYQIFERTRFKTRYPTRTETGSMKHWSKLIAYCDLQRFDSESETRYTPSVESPSMLPALKSRKGQHKDLTEFKHAFGLRILKVFLKVSREVSGSRNKNPN